MENNTKVLVALAAGAMAGLAIGLLIAPDKGSETTKNLGEKSKGFLDDLLEKIETVIDEFEKPKGNPENN